MNANQSWEGLIRPYKVAVENIEDPRRSGTVVVEPLEKGFGVTLGNALRRVLLSSIQGAAVTSIRINGGGGLLEFSSLPGVREDVTGIVLNVKALRLRLHGEGPKKVHLVATGPCVVTAGMIQGGGIVEILDPHHEICSLDASGKIDIEMVVETGKGYVPAGTPFLGHHRHIGEIFLDAYFSPIRKVSYHVESARVGQVTDYDRLLISVDTDGSVTPKDAISIAANILKNQLEAFISFGPSVSSSVPEKDEEVKGTVPFSPILLRKVQDLDLNVRCLNCLQNANITYIGDLVVQCESDLLKTPNFGRKSLNEIKAKLSKFGLRLGGEVPGWPPEDIEALIRESESDVF